MRRHGAGRRCGYRQSVEPACPACGSTALTRDAADWTRLTCDACGETSRWQHTIFLEIDGEALPLTAAETREIVSKLRTPQPGASEPADAAIAAAVHLERLLDEPDAQNPPLTPAEVHEIGLVLLRVEITDGQISLRDAILAHELGT